MELIPDGLETGTRVRITPEYGQSGTGEVWELVANQYGIARVRVYFDPDDCLIYGGDLIAQADIRRRNGEWWIYDLPSDTPEVQLAEVEIFHGE